MMIVLIIPDIEGHPGEGGGNLVSKWVPM
jgi:hypothetical protein